MNILGGEPPASGPTAAGELGPGKNSDWTLRNGCRDPDAEESSGADVGLGANDFDRVNVASALRPLPDVCGSRRSNGRAFAFPFPLSIFGRGSEGSGVGLGVSAGAFLINSDPTLAYPRGARRLSQTRNVAAGTRRATAISSSSGASESGSARSWEGAGASTLEWRDAGGSFLLSGRGRVTR